MAAPIVPRERIEQLRAQAAELLRLARATEHPDVRRLLEVEAYDREDQALALEEWLNGEAPGRSPQGHEQKQAG